MLRQLIERNNLEYRNYNILENIEEYFTPNISIWVIYYGWSSLSLNQKNSLSFLGHMILLSANHSGHELIKNYLIVHRLQIKQIYSQKVYN